jgi:hypothetical protein
MLFSSWKHICTNSFQEFTKWDQKLSYFRVFKKKEKKKYFLRIRRVIWYSFDVNIDVNILEYVAIRQNWKF